MNDLQDRLMDLYRDQNPRKPDPPKAEQVRKAFAARLKGQGFAVGMVVGYALALVGSLFR